MTAVLLPEPKLDLSGPRRRPPTITATANGGSCHICGHGLELHDGMGDCRAPADNKTGLCLCDSTKMRTL